MVSYILVLHGERAITVKGWVAGLNVVGADADELPQPACCVVHNDGSEGLCRTWISRDLEERSIGPSHPVVSRLDGDVVDGRGSAWLRSDEAGGHGRG